MTYKLQVGARSFSAQSFFPALSLIPNRSAKVLGGQPPTMVEATRSWGVRVELVLRLVETGIDGSGQSIDLLEIVRAVELGNLADLSLTLSDDKQLLAQVQSNRLK